MSEPKQQWNRDPAKRCCPSCGVPGISEGARSCRKCFRAGKGALKGRKRGRSILTVMREVQGRNLKRGESVTIDGLTFTRTSAGWVIWVAARSDRKARKG